MPLMNVDLGHIHQKTHKGTTRVIAIIKKLSENWPLVCIQTWSFFWTFQIIVLLTETHPTELPREAWRVSFTMLLTRSSVLTFFPLYIIVVHENKYTPERGDTKTLFPELKWFPSLFKTVLNLTMEYAFSVVSDFFIFA